MTDAAETPQPTVLDRVSGGVGHLTLNRPRALNALDLGMIHRLTDVLDEWRGSSAVDVVVLDGAGERGLCAGGDVRGLYQQIVRGRALDTAQFFRAEYALNAAIGEYPKPVVALADGITMGGGIGLAGHAAIRVVTERSRLAMPETRIGFTPDVGGTWLLSHAPGRVGEYLGMTGTTMDSADALYAGFADVFVPSGRLDDLRRALQGGANPAAIVGGFAESAGPSRLEEARGWIDDAFAADSVPEALERLRVSDVSGGEPVEASSPGRAMPVAEPVEASSPDREPSTGSGTETAATLAELSPTGMAVTLEGVRRARDLPDLRAALAQEYGLVMWFVTTQPDLVEGIRAQLVDKDRSPTWHPASLADVSPDAVASAFSYVPPVPLWG